MENNLNEIVKILSEIYKSCARIELASANGDSAIHEDAVRAMKYTGVIIRACGGDLPASTEKGSNIKKPSFKVVSKK